MLTMAIRRLVKEAAFGPEDIDRMVAAYEAALQMLRLPGRRDDPAAEVVAKKIIEITLAGERDPPRICARALKELGIPLPD